MGEMAKKIIKTDVDDLVKTLNEAYAEEWLAYYQYWLGAKLAEGPERYDIEKEFNEHAGEELKHADWLAKRIIQLGGTPIVKPDEWDSVARCKYKAPTKVDVVTLLTENLAAERCAIVRYQEICDTTQGKDYETFRISRKILKEELEHEQELEDFLSDIATAKKLINP
jgi:bacterioferritin